MEIIMDLTSIVMGLFALLVPLTVCFRKKNTDSKVSIIFSFGACLLSVIIQLLYVKYYTYNRYYSSLEDTIHARCLASIVLTLGVLSVNIFAEYMGKRRRA